MLHRIDQKAVDVFRAFVPVESRAGELAKHVYWSVKGRL